MSSPSLPSAAEANRPESAPPPQGAGALEGGWPVTLLGFPVTPLALEPALKRINGLRHPERPAFVVHATTDLLLAAQRNPELHRHLARADLMLPATAVLAFASSWFSRSRPRRLPARSLCEHLLLEAAAHGRRVFLLGSNTLPGSVASQVGVRIVGWARPEEMRRPEEHGIEHRIKAAKPDLVLVAASDAGELAWLFVHEPDFPPAVFVCTYRGRTSPEAAPSAGLAWRPGPTTYLGARCRRFFHAARFELRNTLEAIRTIRSQLSPITTPGADAKPPALLHASGDGVEADGGSDLTRPTLRAAADFWAALAAARGHAVINLSGIEAIDACGIGRLQACRLALQQTGGELVLLAPSPAARVALAAMGVENWFPVAENEMAARSLLATARPATRAERGLLRTLAWCGEITTANAEDVWLMTTDYMRAFASAGATLVVVNLSRLQFVDSAGAAVMLRIKQWARTLRVALIFTSPPPNVLDLLQCVRAAHLLMEGAQ